MLTLIENGEIYAPEPRGRQSVLLIGDRIVRIGEEIEARVAASILGLEIFREIGVTKLAHLDVRLREEAKSPERVALLDKATVVFFTGGDQLKITSQLGDSPVYQRIEEIYAEGARSPGPRREPR